MSEYVLGAQGATCEAACGTMGRFCSPDISAAVVAMNADNGTAMMAHLGISSCLKNSSHGPGLKWWASDQPNYVSGAEEQGKPESNFKQCLGFVGAPSVAQCSAEYPTARRVCRCTDDAPIPPTPPAPSPSGADYHTLVWVYEWPKEAAPTAAATFDAAAGSVSDRALALVGKLADAGLLRTMEEDALVDAVLRGDARITQLAAAVDGWSAKRAARQLRRAISEAALP